MKPPGWLVAVALMILVQLAGAQSFPNKPVRIVVPYPPGGVTDTVARLVAGSLAERWGHQVIVDNRPGGGTLIGTELVSKAPPDGYTLLMVDPSFAINPGLVAKLPYNSKEDFVPITRAASVPLLLVVHPSLPAKSVPELIALARARPGTLNYASAGIGSSTHMAGELFKSNAGIDIVHIAYKGGGQALADVLSGQVPIFFVGISTILPYITSGRLRALAVAAKHRLKVAPDVPTMAESGIAGYEATAWQGVFAPVGVPKSIVAKIQSDISAVVHSPELSSRLSALGAEPNGEAPEAFAAYVKAQMDVYANAVRAADIRPE